MIRKSRLAGFATAAAMTGLLGGVGATMVGCQSSAGTSVDKATTGHDCKGMNDCKGKGGCKTGDMGCKGMNSCKGKGGCKVAA